MNNVSNLRTGRLIAGSVSLSLAAALWADGTTAPQVGTVSALPLHPSVHSAVKLPELPPAIYTVHVAPQGNDANPGTAKKPFATLERARDEIRSVRQHQNLSRGEIVVRIHEGAYQVNQTFTLGPEDSATENSPISYRAATGEKPVFRGGKRLIGWRQLTDRNEFPRLPAEAQGRVWVSELHRCGITNLLPLILGGFASGNGFRTHPAHELFFNHQAMQLARGPNTGFLRVSEVAIKDGTKGYDREGSKTGKFYYDGDYARRWVGEPELLLYGYWFWDWADSYERVASVDAEHKLITLDPPWHTYGFSRGAPYYAVNALSELDQPGEWYLDRKRNCVLLYPPTDPTKAIVEMSLFANPMVTLQNVSHITFSGLTWELGSADAIKVQGGANCRFEGCTVRNFAGDGIEIQGGQNHGLFSCDISSMGRGGASIAGGNRKTLSPGGHYVENCDIHDLSRIDHTYTPAIILNGVGLRVAHNRLHDVLSSAMRVEGNDHVVEYNEIYQAVTESDDQGGVDMFGDPTYRGNVYRYNYWHHIGNWRGIGDQPKCGQAGIRLDDAISGTLVFGNIFERCSAGKLGFGGIQIHGGKDNVIENNLFIDCAAAISFSPWDANRWREHTKSALENSAIDRELYLKRYPELGSLAQNPNLNHVRGNLALRCGELFRRASANLDATNNAMLIQGEFTPRPNNPLLNRPGFDRIPVEDIGLYRDAWRKRQSK